MFSLIKNAGEKTNKLTIPSSIAVAPLKKQSHLKLSYVLHIHINDKIICVKDHEKTPELFADLSSIHDVCHIMKSVSDQQYFSNYLQLITSFPAPCYPLFCHNHSPQTYSSLLGGRKC